MIHTPQRYLDDDVTVKDNDCNWISNKTTMNDRDKNIHTSKKEDVAYLCDCRRKRTDINKS